MSYKTFEIINGELFINDIAPITDKTIENLNKMMVEEDKFKEDEILALTDFDDLEYGKDILEIGDFESVFI